MSTIRPFLPPPAPARSPGAGARPAAAAEPVKAAQRAFFQAALQQPAQGQGPRAEPQRRVEPKPLDRLPRPGSVLDIKV